MPREYTALHVRPVRARLQQYRFVGESTLAYYEESDELALKRLASHFNIGSITLESFSKIHGKHLKCGNRQIFPPPGANT